MVLMLISPHLAMIFFDTPARENAPRTVYDGTAFGGRRPAGTARRRTSAGEAKDRTLTGALVPTVRRIEAVYMPGIGRHSMISTESPGKIAKCGWRSNIFAAASCDSASTIT